MNSENDPIEIGVLVVLTVLRRMVPSVERDLTTCISFGRPVITTIYDVPARPDTVRDDVQHSKAR